MRMTCTSFETGESSRWKRVCRHVTMIELVDGSKWVEGLDCMLEEVKEMESSTARNSSIINCTSCVTLQKGEWNVDSYMIMLNILCQPR